MSQDLPLTIEGYAVDDLLALPEEQIDGYLFIDAPVTFRAGSAEILGQFRLNSHRLVIELASIDGGGEGVLPTLWSLANRLATARGCSSVEWLVHAVHCASPNLKLPRVLELRGFTVENIQGVGEVCRLVHDFTGGSKGGAG